MAHLGMIAELLSIVTLPLALVFGLVWLSLRLLRGPWRKVPAEISSDHVIWMDEEGEVHRAAAGDLEYSDALHVYYRGNRGARFYPTPVAHDERALLVVTVLLGAVGVIGVVASTVLPLL